MGQLVIDFDRLNEFETSITGEVFFCCLGSTRKKTPDKALYYKIDHDYPLTLAKISFINGINQFHLVSAISANPLSSNFYSKMKGETSRDISQLNIRSLYVYEPSLITGKRKEKRAGERFATSLMKVINPLLSGSWRKYRSIPAAKIARTMFEQSVPGEPGKWLIQFAMPELIKKPL
ncbi:MAG: nucleoside-diphosphate sugar epimerase [Bacteroidota bacterium]|nr:nucleoside-diphosphate sugar epimerase [Bacteroidota bacterium]